MAKEREVASAERLAAEGEIASDESAVAELEIKTNENPTEEPENEPAESTVAKGDSGEAGCPIKMGRQNDSPRCGRRIHDAPDGVDERPVCLMHSNDPGKQSGPLCDAFWLEFERILDEAKEGEAHFERFIFPEIDFRDREFHAICRFDFATFTQDAHFNFAIFKQDASFIKSTFAQEANFLDAIFTQGTRFSLAIFTQEAIFQRATFIGDSSFIRTTFLQKAHFSYATFKQYADFGNATFTKKAYFQSASFTWNADFYDARFEQDTSFSAATFTQDADFWRATFAQDTNFHGANFTQNAIFWKATFTQGANFSEATFTKAALFKDTKFYGSANWGESRFLDQAEFRQTKFEPLVEGEPSAVFALAKFFKPDEVVFDDVDLSRALFHNCDISQVWFTSSVTWGKRKGNRGLAVFEETIPLDQKFVEGLQRDGQRDYRAVAQIYQQLKKNYDSRLDYWTANEFHFGEMEMKRQAVPTDGQLRAFLRVQPMWLRQWLHRRLSLIALYKYASDYGNSYWKPLLWLFVILLAATLLFPITGLELKQAGSRNAASSASVTYSSVWDRQNSWTNNFWTEAKLIGKSGITAIDTATFQRTPEYTPVYPRGRVVAIVETLLTSSLFALFLLAIRRQFKR
jgi:uncharacterized protein YjbI with pentapeptide repeats